VLTLHGASSPVAVQDGAIVGVSGGRLVRFEPERGVPLWEAVVTPPRGRSELDRIADLDADPVVVGDIAYVATYNGDLAAVDIDTGDILWRRELSAHAGLSGRRDGLYITDSEGQPLGRRTRRRRRTLASGRTAHRRLTAPALLGNYVLVGDREGYVHLISRRDGQLLGFERVAKDRIGHAGGGQRRRRLRLRWTTAASPRCVRALRRRRQRGHSRAAAGRRRPRRVGHRRGAAAASHDGANRPPRHPRLERPPARRHRPCPSARPPWTEPPEATAMLPVIALVGRPNVGKSTLFNRLTRTRDALVADFPGLTRDRQYGIGRIGPGPYLVVDTGGISGGDGVEVLMERQVRPPSTRPTTCCSWSTPTTASPRRTWTSPPNCAAPASR
jgi:hypothetical protein